MPLVFLFLGLTLTGCASVSKPTFALHDLDARLNQQQALSWGYLQKNISPQEPKTPGGPRPLPGIVVAALSKSDPDYYFHWIRDSANVMRVVLDYTYLQKEKDQLNQYMSDFISLSAKLQEVASPFALGEPRYTVDGQVDQLPWSRPQYDGPALRALSLMAYLELPKADTRANVRAQGLKVLRRDIDFLKRVWNQRSFDIWEEYFAENYHTRLVQLEALEQSQKWLAHSSQTQAAIGQLKKQLDDHWDPARGFLRAQVVIEKTDGYTAKKTDLDSAVLVAVIESKRVRGPHSVMDDRVQATVRVLEDLFRTTYPINSDRNLGLAYGRYPGDIYYGGNPWYLITAYYALFYYRLAEQLHLGHEFAVTARNHRFVQGLLEGVASVKVDEKLNRSDSRFELLRQACMRSGDKIMQRLIAHAPADGQLSEQFDKNNGKPIGSRGLGWSHSTFLEAFMKRRHMSQN